MKWTPEQVEYLVEKYPMSLAQDVADALGINLCSVYNKAYSMGLKKDKRFAAITTSKRWQEGKHENAKKTQFTKGGVPMNKGVPQTEWMPKESILRTKKTRFKKGDTPHNYKPVGSERVNKDGYVEIKVKDPRTWELKHRHVWRQVHGEISKGDNIQFKDGNRLNVVIENLYCIPRTDQMKVNGIYNYPPDLVRLIKTQKRLEKKLNEKQDARR